MSAMMGLPFFLEDTTGYITGPTDFFDIYDRPPFIHVENRVEIIARRTKVDIAELNIRNGSPLNHHRMALILQPGLEGYVVFGNKGNEAMLNVSEWLSPVEGSRSSKKVPSRQFTGSDGERYRWSYHTDGHEWTCTCLDTNIIVAHYDLKSVHEPKYLTSGNVLMVLESYRKLVLEFVASLILMRHLFSIGAL